MAGFGVRMKPRWRAFLPLGALITVLLTGFRVAAADSLGSPVGTPATPAPTSAVALDVFVGVLSDAQRKMLERDSRCQDASSAMHAFVAASGEALQTGIDAMSSLEKCAALPRVGADWSDFRDYVITAAAALAYAVGSRASDERLLRRAADDASRVSGFDAGNVTVTTYERRGLPSSNDATGHGLTDGPAQSSAKVVHDERPVRVYGGSYGRVATAIARAANERLVEIASAAHAQQH